jgi:hypothetical protein
MDVISPSILFFPRICLMPKYVSNLLAVAPNPVQNSDNSAMHVCREWTEIPPGKASAREYHRTSFRCRGPRNEIPFVISGIPLKQEFKRNSPNPIFLLKTDGPVMPGATRAL